MTEGFSFTRSFPFLRLLETASLALSPMSILIAALAMIVLNLTSGLVDLAIRPGTPAILKTEPVDPLAAIKEVTSEVQRHSIVTFDLSAEVERIAQPELIQPWSALVRPAITIINHPHGLSSWLNVLLHFATSLALWSLVGVIICRRAAFLFAGNDSATMMRAVKYSSRRWLTTVGAPIIPLAAGLLIGAALFAMGLLGLIPGLGGVWLTVISPLTALLGLAMAFLFFVTIFSWPLMVSAVAVDDCDSFGGLSRAYSNLTGRPWHAVLFVLTSIIVGRLLMFVVHLLAETSIWFAESSVSFGAGAVRTDTSLHPPLLYIVQLVVSSIGVSFFWSAAAIIYLMLRQEVDMAPFERIALDDEDRPVRDPLPVVGIPATDAKPDQDGIQTA